MFFLGQGSEGSFSYLAFFSFLFWSCAHRPPPPLPSLCLVLLLRRTSSWIWTARNPAFCTSYLVSLSPSEASLPRPLGPSRSVPPLPCHFRPPQASQSALSSAALPASNWDLSIF